MDPFAAITSFKPHIQQTIGLASLAATFYYLMLYFITPSFFAEAPTHVTVLLAIGMCSLEILSIALHISISSFYVFTDNESISFASIISLITSANTLLLFYILGFIPATQNILDLGSVVIFISKLVVLLSIVTLPIVIKIFKPNITQVLGAKAAKKKFYEKQE